MIYSPIKFGLLVVFTTIFYSASVFSHTTAAPIAIEKDLAKLESTSGGRIGLFAINTANNTMVQYRANERFPMCSTSKVMAVATMLKQSMKDSHLLQKRIVYMQKEVDASGYAPETSKHIADGMTIDALCAAAMTQSDNLAMNLLLQQLGGPAAVTRFARSIGDTTYRLDRIEPELNTAIPGDLRDTTTPAAMGYSLQRLVLGDVLHFSQRQQLLSWLKNNKTGDARIRAGVPRGWLVGDKTGTGSYGTTNDIAIIWPPKQAPIIVVIYFTQYKENAVPRDDIIASVTRLLLGAVKTDD